MKIAKQKKPVVINTLTGIEVTHLSMWLISDNLVDEAVVCYQLCSLQEDKTLLNHSEGTVRIEGETYQKWKGDNQTVIDTVLKHLGVEATVLDELPSDVYKKEQAEIAAKAEAKRLKDEAKNK